MATTLIEAPEPVHESIGVDDPKTAHGGRPRRTLGPPVPGGLMTRVRPPVVLPTMVRRVAVDASHMVEWGDHTARSPAPTADWSAELALLGR